MIESNTKPWLSSEYDLPVLENEEMWMQRIIDDKEQNDGKEQHDKDNA